MASSPRYPAQPGLEVNKAEYPSSYAPQPSNGHVDQAGLEYVPCPTTSQSKDRTICGLRGTTFCLVLALIFVIIAAAVGGGVGGSLAVNSAKKYCIFSYVCKKKGAGGGLPVNGTQKDRNNQQS